MKLKPGDIFWDGRSWCLVFWDEKHNIHRNMQLDDFVVRIGNLQGDTLDENFTFTSKISNISNIHEELMKVLSSIDINT